MKKYYPHFPLWFIWLLIIFAFMILSGGGIVGYILEKKYNSLFECLCLIACIIVFILSLYLLYKQFQKKIILWDDRIYVIPDSVIGLEKLQHEVTVFYSDIENIYFVATNNDTLNRPVHGSFVLRPLLVLEDNNGKQNAIDMYFYTKRQTCNIIDDIRERAIKAGNNNLSKSGKEILDEFLQSFKKKKK